MFMYTIWILQQVALNSYSAQLLVPGSPGLPADTLSLVLPSVVPLNVLYCLLQSQNVLTGISQGLPSQWAVTPSLSLWGHLERSPVFSGSLSSLGPANSWTEGLISFICVIGVPLPHTVHLCSLCLRGGAFNHRLIFVSKTSGVWVGTAQLLQQCRVQHRLACDFSLLILPESKLCEAHPIVFQLLKNNKKIN